MKLTLEDVEKDLGTQEPILSWRQEIDNYYDEMRAFNSCDITEILRKLSSMSARMSAIRSQLVRSPKRVAAAFRTQEVDPFLEECDRQFKIWSRFQAVMTLEWDMAKGQ